MPYQVDDCCGLSCKEEDVSDLTDRDTIDVATNLPEYEREIYEYLKQAEV